MIVEVSNHVVSVAIEKAAAVNTATVSVFYF
jgi:hypothetical protein